MSVEDISNQSRHSIQHAIKRENVVSRLTCNWVA